MTRLRLTLADNEGRKSASEHEHSYDLPGGLPRFVDMEAARWRIASSKRCQSWPRSS
jgi:hypothetical protein